MATTAAESRKRVFLDVNVGTEPVGRLVIELFTDKAPKTCENFRALCSGEHQPLTYRNSRFHRIIDEFMIQGGDITKGDGTGGISIYGGEFDDENIGWMDIDTDGLLCMANRGRSTNGTRALIPLKRYVTFLEAQFKNTKGFLNRLTSNSTTRFFITLAPCPHLNAKHTVFGRIVSGQSVLQALGKVPVNKDDRPLSDVLIANCGELERRKKLQRPVPPAEAPSRTSVDEKERGRRKRRASGSPSSSSSTETAGHQYGRAKDREKHAEAADRRRSDGTIDHTLRGRPRRRTRSPSPVIPDSRRLRKYHRKGNRSPSETQEADEDRNQSGEQAGWRRRRSLPNQYNSVQGERRTKESRDERYSGQDARAGTSTIQEDEEQWQYSKSNRDGGYESFSHPHTNRDHSDGQYRLDSLDHDEWSGVASSKEVKYKGRGSMKYREWR